MNATTMSFQFSAVTPFVLVGTRCFEYKKGNMDGKEEKDKKRKRTIKLDGGGSSGSGDGKTDTKRVKSEPVKVSIFLEIYSSYAWLCLV